MALSSGDSNGVGGSSALDPVLRAAAFALALAPSQSEFGVLARIPDGAAIRARPDVRFGYAVQEADGTILPPDGHPPRAEGAVFAALRIDLALQPGMAAEDPLPELLARLEDLAGEGWDMRVERLPGSPFSAAMEALHARPDDLPPLPGGAPDGTGVLVGAVDFGCAFAHPAFRLGTDGLGGTRLRLLWDQNGPAPRGAMVPGRRYGPAELDALLSGGDPYPEDGYVPWENGYAAEPAGRPVSELGRRLSVHGTHVLSVAAGRRPQEGAWARGTPPGIAPGAALGFVHLRPRALVSEGDAVDVFDGVCALFDLAAREGMPAVVNLSVGANTGAHDGQGLMDRALDALLRMPSRAITVAAGNMRDAGLNRSGSVAAGRPATLRWRFEAGDPTPNMLRIYAPMQEGMPALDLALGRPGGAPASALRPEDLRGQAVLVLKDAAGEDPIGTAASTTRPPTTEEPVQHFELRLRPSGREEVWQVTLSLGPEAVSNHAFFDAWIERDDLRRHSGSRFEPPDPGEETLNANEGPGCSLGSLACAEGPICVAAVALPDGGPAPFSSMGGTRIGGEKPDVAAPGLAVPGASGLGGLRDGAGQTFAAGIRMDGTSAAAPQVAGVIALMLQARPRLTAERIRAILRATTRERQADPGAAWQRDIGAGRVDAAAAMAMTLEEPE
ncbi:S8 family serine peptidase [Roseomonas populi]|uniref:S8 family serine peptidase n=1 Tax=Roseomonas populi TaxID=3121582 RepID=A0ABT1X4N9_9PROT|nr:S8 family serine peptidase [Roseomonas pecuniae]MCR0982741.1 S8 family serine peptidase [Roseomonas pecuniae]